MESKEAKGGNVKVEEPEGKMTLAMFDVKILENDDEDLNDHQQETFNDKKSASEILEEIKSIPGQDRLSSREVNRLKRKGRAGWTPGPARRRKRRPRMIQRK